MKLQFYSTSKTIFDGSIRNWKLQGYKMLPLQISIRFDIYKVDCPKDPRLVNCYNVPLRVQNSILVVVHKLELYYVSKIYEFTLYIFEMQSLIEISK